MVYAVIRGFLNNTAPTAISKKLEKIGYDKLISRKTKKRIPLFLVKTRTKDIFKVVRPLDLVVTLEPKK